MFLRLIPSAAHNVLLFSDANGKQLSTSHRRRSVSEVGNKLVGRPSRKVEDICDSLGFAGEDFSPSLHSFGKVLLVCWLFLVGCATNRESDRTFCAQASRELGTSL